MAERLNFFLLGDQSLSVYETIVDFFRRQSYGVLSKSFLERATAALQDEVDRLPIVDRRRIPSFANLQQLNERYYQQQQKTSALDGALLCIAQLALYIEQQETLLDNHNDKPINNCLVGLCTGLLAATAIASAPTLSTLIPIATEIVLVAFRLGGYIAGIADRLDAVNGSSESWTYVVPEVNEESASTIIRAFHLSGGISLLAQVYVSATNASSVSISGPPSTLKALLNTKVFQKIPLQLPIHGPYHAAHLHSSASIEKLLRLKNSFLSRTLVNYQPSIPVLSCANGSTFGEKNCYDLLLAAVSEILTKPLDFQKVLDGCVAKAEEFQGSNCHVIPLGQTHSANSLVTTLSNKTSLKVVLRCVPSAELDINRSSSVSGKLAIVGMAGRFPDAASHQKLWELLEQGLDVHREVPKDRFDVATHVDLAGKVRNTSHTPYGCWIENPGMFDPRFFNMSPREAFQTDPMQRMALSTAYEALEMSGYVPNRTRSTQLDRIGTFYGQTSDDWREINAAQEVDTYFITGGVRAFGPGRINYHFGFSGPSFNIDTACSSSAAAIQLAATSLWAKDCDTAVVGGLSCMTNSDIFAGLSRGQFLSKRGPCATFDNDADGYCRADACATVIMKRLEDAIADNDNVLAIMLGAATNHSADAISITHPHAPTQEVLYKSILEKSGVDAIDIDYVEMHGTGTQAGDVTEMLSVTNVFAPTGAHKRTAEQPLYLGSVKANVGHGEAASGITALIKCLMMLQHNAIPPHVGIKGTINQGFPKDLADRNVNIAFSKTPLRSRTGRGRRIYLSNFSAAGGNTGVLLEEAVARAHTYVDPRSCHIVAITAKSKSALHRNVERLCQYLKANPNTSVADLSYSTTARHIHHNWRISVTGSRISQIQEELRNKLQNEKSVPISPKAPKVAFIFTGQGSHYAALGKELYETSTVFRDSVDELNRLSLIHGFPSFIPLIDGSAEVETLSPVVVQLGLVCFEISLAKLWSSWGITPSAVVGHSLGEYAALNIAGVHSASDTIYLVGTRAQMLVDSCTAGIHAMLAVQESSTVLSAMLGASSTLNIACINGPRETVLAGPASDIAGMAERLGNATIKCTQLKVPFAFHSSQVDSILDRFQEIAGSVVSCKEHIPVISSILGSVLDKPVDAAYLRNHARDPVNILGGLIAAQKDGLIDEKTVWLEIGPHPVCLAMVKSIFGAATFGCPTVQRNEVPYKTLSKTLSVLHTTGLAIDWTEYHRDFSSSLRLLDLPSYSFDDKNYWIQYEGDWCLTKGDKKKDILPAVAEQIFKFSTSSIHEIMSQVVDGDHVTVCSESDLARPDLRGVVSGHVVNGAFLCPSASSFSYLSLYADMAMTLCDYAYRLVRPDEKDLVANVAKMQVPKILLARVDGKSQIVRLAANVDVAKGRADLVFTTGQGEDKVEHATCKVLFDTSTKCLSDWAKNAYLIQSRVNWLQEAGQQGKAHKIGRGLAYKLFAALVDYNQKYRGMEEVILHSENMEATARVKFQTTEKDGSFMCSPFWIDSVAHISGFIVNGSDATNSIENVYISHGWESLQFAEPLVADKTYRSYVKMQSQPGKIMAGDVYIFDGERIVACVGGLKFQCIPRKVLNTVLPPPGATSTRASVPRPSAAVEKKSTFSKRATPRITTENIQSANKNPVTVTSRALEILVTEIGVGLDELDKNVAFVDLGCDSLMSLAISGRLREELEIEINSHDFQAFQTISEFTSFVAKFEVKIEVQSESPTSSSTLDTSLNDFSADEADTSATTTSNGNHSLAGKENEITQTIRAAIAAEMSCDIGEIYDDADLNSLGMDSLMNLTVLGALREQTGLTLSGDLLTSNRTIREIKRALSLEAPPNPQQTVSKTVVASQTETKVETSTTVTSSTKPNRTATSILLQGNSRTARKHLWMVPDGGGSATSYVGIPDLSPEVAVWGLNSPYMRFPEEYSIGVVGMASKFITEIKRRQPYGPYLLAGWSAGGVIAFEATNQLTKSNDEVEQLILVDSPCPDIIEPLPSSLHRWFGSIGLLGDGDDSKLPPWLLPHFAASVAALSSYNAEKIQPSKCPLVTAIWCEDGVCKLPTDPKPDPFPYGHAQFLLDNRTDFGPNLWDRYINAEKLRCRQMPGNHVSNTLELICFVC
ncbi:BcPKS12, polyketide synthase [Calycina marina]|uniref:BcPKS12, polyketide synthase n=1 Tax=Calycina marina TaxID=1763456 RepID=A0A9P8CGN7_9HELO|nr:BcPKS12, polyketide synthase [Calycina marina]